jgi:glutamyl-tRNA reductase
MQYAVLGLNHRSAAVSIREQLALNDARLREALSRAASSPQIPEAVILSTCNRVEFYTASPQPQEAVGALWSIVEEVCGLHKESLRAFRPHLYDLQGDEAVRHLFRVASSLDSLVLGEAQILGQLKDAYQKAAEHQTVGRYLGRGMERAFSTAKRVRTETRLGASGVSIAYVAVQLAEKIFGTLRDKAVLLIGAGDMAELAARHLLQHGATRPVIANRSLDRAQALAESLGGTARQLEALPELLLAADIVITSTGSDRPILRRDTLQGIMRARKYRPLFLIDIAVPRDIEAAAGDLDNVYLYDIDDLEQIVASNLEDRRREAAQAEQIVQDEVERFRRWNEEADIVPTVVALRKHVTEIKDAELEEVLGKLKHLSEKDQQLVRTLGHRLANKFLHSPTVNLKRRASERQVNQDHLDLLRALFDLPDEAPISPDKLDPSDR